MVNQEAKIVILGVGRIGIEYMTTVTRRLTFPTHMVAVGAEQAVLDETADHIRKIKVSKRLAPHDAVDRVASKLRTAVKDRQICFLLGDIEQGEPVAEMLPEIAKMLTESECLCFGLFTTPSTLGGRRVRNKARNLFWRITDSMSSCEFAKDHIGADAASLIAQAMEAICRMLNHTYIGINAVEVALRKVGRIHLMGTTMDASRWQAGLYGRDQRRNDVWKLMKNDKLDTSLHAAESVLVHISVSPNLRKEDLQYLLLEIQGLADPEASMDISIDVNGSLDGKIVVEVLAVGVWTNEEWDDMF